MAELNERNTAARSVEAVGTGLFFIVLMRLNSPFTSRAYVSLASFNLSRDKSKSPLENAISAR